MKKAEAKMYLMSFKQLKNYNVINIDTIETLKDGSLYIVFSASNGCNGYYGLLEHGLIDLELAGKLEDLQ